MSDTQKLYVGYVTAGRREQLGKTLEQLGKQRRLPDKIIVCPASPEDFDPSTAAWDLGSDGEWKRPGPTPDGVPLVDLQEALIAAHHR